VVLARWMTSPDNPTFSRAIANRLWSHYFGRGLVEPLDDLRATNPATNEPLLEELAKHLRDKKYDLKAFTRTLLNSRLYQLASPTMSAAIGGGKDAKLPLPSGRGAGGEGPKLPSPSGRGAGGEGPKLPSPSGRGAGGEGTFIPDEQNFSHAQPRAIPAEVLL